MAGVPIANFEISRKGIPTHVETVQVSFATGEENPELFEAMISLYHHCLPRLGKKYLRKILANSDLKTFIMLRSVQDVLDHRHRIGNDIAAGRESPTRLEKELEDAEEEEGGEEDEDTTNDDTSSFSHGSDAEEEEEEEEGEGEGEGGEEEEEEEEEESESESEGEEEEQRKEGGGEGEGVEKTKVDEAVGADDNDSNNNNADNNNEESVPKPKPTRKSTRDLTSDDSVRLKERILAALTWESPQTALDTRLKQVTLISVRLKFQGYSLARRLMQMAQNMALVGQYDAMVTYADTDAVDWFKRQGFTDDLIINRKRKKIDEYAQQLMLLEKMKREIVSLREKVVRQDLVIDHLTRENIRHQQEKLQIEEEYMRYRLQHPPSRPARVGSSSAPPSADLSLGVVLEEDSPELAALRAQFLGSLRPAHGISGGNILTAIKLSREGEEAFKAEWQPRGPVIHLYLGLHVKLLRKIASRLASLEEVTSDPYCLDVFGKGLYLSRYASKSHHYTQSSPYLLQVAVALGRNETVVTENPARSSPSAGFDSVVVPGRRLPLSPPMSQQQRMNAPAQQFAEEFLLFNLDQIFPLYLIRYSVEESEAM